MARRWLLSMVTGLLLALLATTAWAGGIVVGVEGAMPQAAAGTPFTLHFSIRSAHDGSMQSGFDPTVIATNPATGETVQVDALSLEQPGQYAATLTLPTAGEWNWKIVPMTDYPEEFVLELTPLQVQPAGGLARLAAPGSALAWLAAPPALLALLAALAVGLAGVALRRRAAVRA